MPPQTLPDGWIEVPLETGDEPALIGIDNNKIAAVAEGEAPNTCTVYLAGIEDGFDLSISKDALYARIISTRSEVAARRTGGHDPRASSRQKVSGGSAESQHQRR